MEFDTLKVAPRNAPPQGLTRELTAPELVSCFTQGMVNATAEILDKFAQLLPVSVAADATLRERFQQRRATAPQPPATKPAPTSHVSAFDWLKHHKQSPQKEDPWTTHLEIMPQKIERGWQPDRSQECSGRSTSQSEEQSARSCSQKRHSQLRSRDEVDSKKGQTEEGTGKSCKVQVGIDWANTGIQKPALKPDPQHPSFKPDPSEATDSPLLPQTFSPVILRDAKQQHRHRKEHPKRRKGDKVSGPRPAKFLGDPEKREVKDKSYDWITRRMNRLDPKGYMKEIYSFWHFGRNSKSFALEIIAIADWGQRYMELGLNYPIPMFPAYLFNLFSESCQAVRQVPMKPDY